MKTINQNVICPYCGKNKTIALKQKHRFKIDNIVFYPSISFKCLQCGKTFEKNKSDKVVLKRK